MDKDHLKDIEKWLENADWQGIPIPNIFHSAYLEGPFTRCTGCDKDLQSASCLYEIQKVYKGKEPIFEYALCTECGENLVNEYSQESLAALQQYFIKNYWPSKQEDQCHLCHETIAEETGQERAIMALCKGDQLMIHFILCQSCMEAMEELISEKTRKTMGDFIENKFPGIPAEFTPFPMLQV